MVQVISITPTPPQVPIPPPGTPSFSQMITSIADLYKWSKKLNTWLTQYLTQVAQSVNTSICTFGQVLPSAPTIIFTEALHHVSGTAAISTIQVPPNFAGGPLWLVADGAWTLVTGGNIAHSASPLVGQCICVVYDPVIKLHYPVQ